MRLHLGLTAFALALALAPARAQAQDSASQADKVFREGRAAATAGDFATARARFLESERLEPAPGTLLNIADSEVHLGMLVAAREHFQLAASGFPRSDSRRAWATSQAELLGKRIAHLTLRLDPSAPAGTTLTRAGSPVDPATLGTATAADPGTLEIVVTAPGRAPRSTTLTLAEGQSVERTVSAGEPLPAPEPATTAPTPAPAPTTATGTAVEHPLRSVGYIVGGVGVAGLIVGSVTGLLALDKANTMKSHCNTSTWACDSQGTDAASAGGTFSTVSTVSFVAGAVLVGAGAYLFFSSREAPTTAFVPFGDAHGAGAALVHTF